MSVWIPGLVLGLWLGLAAGVSPGPMLALVVTTALRWGVRPGLAMACAPLLSDVVVVTVVVLALREAPHGLVTALGVVGGVLVALLGAATARESRTASLTESADGAAPRPAAALRRGVLVNLLSPHPWIAWITALGPLTITEWRNAPGAGVLFVVGFYLTLVGSKMAIALLVSGTRHRLTDPGYRRAVLLSGLALVGVGLVLVVDFGRSLL